jgi:glucose-1-phosphate adenylyltransferase
MEERMARVLALILAGGKGERLEPLTRDRAKPAVPFGGVYRIIDFTLSNCINSGLRRMLVLTQYKAASLDRHINMGWRFLCRELDEFIDVLPPQQRIDEHWYKGTADAVYQNIYNIERTNPDYIVILSGDHIYKMDYSELLRDHMHAEADLTIGCIPVPLVDGRHFGVMRIDSQNRVVEFLEKPASPDPMPDDPKRCLASMGIYVFSASFLFEQLCRDATLADSQHDFGRNIIPSLIGSYLVRAYPFRDKNTGRSRYWRDVGTLDAYFDAHQDLLGLEPRFNVFNPRWRIGSSNYQGPSARIVRAEVDNSILGAGTLVKHARIKDSIVRREVVLEEGAVLDQCVVMDYTIVRAGAQLRRVIVDRYNTIASGSRIGFDAEADRAAGYHVTESGIVVVPKGDHTVFNRTGGLARYL